MPVPDVTRPTGDSTSRTHWGAPKRCRSLSLSDEAWDLLTQIAVVKGINRSEVVERMVRKATELT
jgi:hypothetical protein